MAGAPFFDAHLLADAPEPRTLPPSGGIVRAAGCGISNDARWHRAGVLSTILGPQDARFPADARVIDLDFPDAEWHARLHKPAAEWFPLCGAPRTDGRRPIIHLNTLDFPKLARGLVQLARRFPQTRFIVDPFMTGSDEHWRAGVCLADQPNVWATTRGLFGPHTNWKRGFYQEALYFIVGEIGAGKGLFASGLRFTDWARASELALPHPEEWLRHCKFLDEAQITLLLRENFVEVMRD
jgi:hypothetical protein